MKSPSDKVVQQLLTHNLNHFQQMLNGRLLDQLSHDYAQRRRADVAETRVHLRSIPRHAREKWLLEAGISLERRQPENAAARTLLDFLTQEVDNLLGRLQQLRSRNAEFRISIAKTQLADQRQQTILDYARDLGASRAEIRGDARALARWLNEDAMNDRYIRLKGETEQRLAFGLERLGNVAARTIELVGLETAAAGQEKATPVAATTRRWRVDALRNLWGRLNVEKVVQQVLVYDGDLRVRLAAMKCLSFAFAPLPRETARVLMHKVTLPFFLAAALDRSADVWVQCEALSLLYRVAPDELLHTFQHRLAGPSDGDDMFVRRHAVSLMAECFQNLHDLPDVAENVAQLTGLLGTITTDPSEFVRQQVAVTACYAPADVAMLHLEWLALSDPSPKVRAATLVAMMEHPAHKALSDKLLDLIHCVLTKEQDEFVVRTAIMLSWQWLERFSGPALPEYVHERFHQVILDDLLRIESSADTTVPMRRWSAQARERIWLLLDAEARELYDRLKQRAAALQPGCAARVPRKWFRGFDLDSIGRVLAVMAQDDFGYDLDRDWVGYRLVRGPVFQLRLWRIWFELRNQTTDKRQAFRHTIGRVSDATVRAPSQIMGELSQTKVPGEPFFVVTDGSWRPFLPLVDDFISALHRNWFVRRPVRFYTSQGVTEVFAPTTIFKRLCAFWRLTLRFPDYARLRNWEDDPQRPPMAYLDAIGKLGFTVRLRPHTDRKPASRVASADDGASQTHDTSVGRSFPCVVVLAMSVSDAWKGFEDYAQYFGSTYENSLVHLVIFVTLATTFFFGKHLLANISLRRARRNIPISLGGWGTRGKSGTERLKAALIGAMGHGLVSKTTGCEAMFIQADAFGEPLEIPLFRPYDKATIWEQSNILKLASRLKPSVFLWECMGLTPAYVEVLQRQWTRDDIATITNTYPDHEDLQGPTGYNVATTISGFVPRKSHLLTTEQEMRPMVAASCHSVGTTLRGVGWLQSGLITDDVQDRFPYKEHPDNIALVAAMGDELGVSYEFAVKAMADYMVPDLGVLKTYPVSDVRSRRIEFTNGMSANERFGCLGNWKRMDFANHDPHQDIDTWVCGVVNNRADRVPRSRVFASIMVDDVSVDRFYLIGNNLKGLQGFVAEAFAERAKQLTLCGVSDSWNKDDARAALEKAAKDFRQPTCAEHIQLALRAMLSVCVDESKINLEELLNHWDHPDEVRSALGSVPIDEELVSEIGAYHAWLLRAVREFDELAKAIDQANAGDAAKLDQQFVQQLETWFNRKMVFVENYDATGEEVVKCIVDETPPGYLNRVMGLQNIKGTGLDFVYRFQTWDACYNACEQLKDEQVRVAEKGIQALSAMPVLGQLCEKKVRETIAHARQATNLQRSDLQTELDVIEAKIQTPHATATTNESGEESEPAKKGRSPFVEKFVAAAEQYFDVNDSVHRRDTADRVYRDLAKGRISRQNAVEQLRKVNKRQKGGWLATEWFGK